MPELGAGNSQYGAGLACPFASEPAGSMELPLQRSIMRPHFICGGSQAVASAIAHAVQGQAYVVANAVRARTQSRTAKRSTFAH